MKAKNEIERDAAASPVNHLGKGVIRRENALLRPPPLFDPPWNEKPVKGVQIRTEEEDSAQS